MTTIQSTTVNIPIKAKANIEQELKKLGFDVLRWAVVEVKESVLVVSLSYISS